MRRTALHWSVRILCGTTCLLAAAACQTIQSLPPAPTQGEQCRAWGYAPDDPECLKVFRRYAP